MMKLSNIKILKGEWLYVVFCFAVCLLFCFTYYSNRIASDNFIYAIGEINEYNNNLMANNVVNIGVSYSPRAFANHIISFLMNFSNGNWAGAAVFVIRLNYVLYAVVFTYLILKLVKGPKLLMAVLFMACIMGNTMGTLSHGTNGAGDIFLGTGIPISMLAIALVLGEKKHWTWSWLLLAVSALLHIHEGIWGGCAVGVLWICHCIKTKRLDLKAITGWIVYVPILLLIILPGAINDGVADGKLFVEIYANIRHPHHLIISSWGAGTVIKYAFMVAVPILVSIVIMLKNKDKEALFKNGITFAALVLFWIFLLMLEYVGTEVAPNASIATMYVVKGFKYITFLIAFFYLKIGEHYYLKREYLKSALIWLMMFIGIGNTFNSRIWNSMIVFIAFVIISIGALDKRIFDFNRVENDVLIQIAEWSALIFLMYRFNGKDKIRALLFTVVLVITFYQDIIKIRGVYYISVICAFLVSAMLVFNGRIANISRNGIDYISGNESLINTVGIDLYNMACEFAKKTGNDDVFLYNPDDETGGWFQLVSQRSVYCSWKAVPSSKVAVMEWYDRCISTRAAMEAGADEMAEYMDQIGVDYLLVKTENADVYEESDCFDVFLNNEQLTMLYKKG